MVAVGGGGQFAWSVPDELVAYGPGHICGVVGWAGCGDVAAPVDTEGLAARAGLRPLGNAPRKRSPVKQGVVGRGPSPCWRSSTPSAAPALDSGETQLRNTGYFGVLGRDPTSVGVGSELARRGLACRGAGRPRSRPGGAAGTAGTEPPEPRHPFRPLLRPTTTMPPQAPRHLRQNPFEPAPGPPTRRTTRGPNPTRRPQLLDRTGISPEPSYRT